MSTIFNDKDNVRRAAVAGSFYPSSSGELTTMVKQMLNDAKTFSVKSNCMIVPHAGYIYSGPVAATAYKTLSSERDNIKRVMIIGPSHHQYFKGLCVHSAKYFETPLGRIELDQEYIKEKIKQKVVHINDEAHNNEHSLEVQLPFLQILLPNIKLVPVLFSDCDISQIINLIEDNWNKETLILISTDLSHFHDYYIARHIDGETVENIMNKNFDKITPDKACGSLALRAALAFASKKNFSIEKLDVRNSGDTAGGTERVVGYGAFALC